MPTPERPSILDLCPTCGSPKPCSLHNEEFLKGLLEDEKPKSIAELFERRELEKQGNKIKQVVSLSEKRFVIDGDKCLKLYTRQDNEWIATEMPLNHVDHVRSITALSPSLFVANQVYPPDRDGYYDETIAFFKVEGNEISCVDEIEENIFRNKEKIVKISESEFILFSNYSRGLLLLKNNGEEWSFEDLRDYSGDVKVVAKLSKSLFVVGGRGGGVLLNTKHYDEETQDYEWFYNDVLDNYGNDITSICPLSEKQFVVGGMGGAIVLYKKRAGFWVSEDLESYGSNVKNICLLSDSEFVVGGLGGNVKLYKKRGESWIASDLEASAEPIDSITQLSESMFVVGSGKQVKVYEKQHGNWSATVVGQHEDINYFDVTRISNLEFAVSGNDGSLTLYGLPSEEKLREFHERQIEDEEIEEMPEW